MSRIDSTQNFKVVSESENRVGDILAQVYQAMTEKGYNCLLYTSPLEKGPDEETEAPELESLHAFRQGFTAVELSGMQIQ